MLLLSLSLSLALAASPRKARRAAADAQAAEAALAQGDVAEAYERARAALERDPANSQAIFVQSVVLLALSQEPNNPDAMAMFAVASQAMERLQATDPESPYLAKYWAIAGALIQSPLLAEPDPGCSPEAEAAISVAEGHFQRREMGQAAVAYDQALALCPQAASWWTWSGDVPFQAGDYKAAIVRYQKALSLDACYWPAHRFLADAYVRVGDLRRAHQEAALAVACNPDYGLGWDYLQALVTENGGQFRRIEVVKPEVERGEGGAKIGLPEGSLATMTMYALLKGSTAEASALARERAAVRGALEMARESGSLNKPENAVWKLLSDAEAAGYLDEAIFVLLLDEALVPEFLEHRAQHRDRLAAYVAQHLAVLP